MTVSAKEFLKEKVKEMTLSLKEEWDEKEFEKHIQEDEDVWKFIVNVMGDYAERKVKEFIDLERDCGVGNLKDVNLAYKLFLKRNKSSNKEVVKQKI